MEKPDALEKRIKRNVTAREQRFFVVVSPGLVKVCHDELSRLFNGEKDISEKDGGLEFQGTVLDCYRANLCLRTASRIIMRLSEFTATEFSVLEKKIRDFPWELYLSKNHTPSIHVTAKKSKLYHSGAIDQRFRENIAWRLGPGNPSTAPGTADGEAPNIYVRVLHDRFELSLDSTGPLLYLRGLKTLGGRAPLRETLASGLLLMAGYKAGMPLLDPMCGSGSFSLEAAMITRNIPPGWYREFAFQSWPCFREGALKHIRKTEAAAISEVCEASIFASDSDEKACKAIADQGLSAGFSDMIQVRRADVFDLDPSLAGQKKGLVMVNPPYGRRLGTERQSELFIADLFRMFESRFSGWRVGVISPFEKERVKAPRNLRQHAFYHGGLNLFFINGVIR